MDKTKLTAFRTVKPVQIDGNTIAYVRSLSIAELRDVEARGKALPPSDERDLEASKIIIAQCVCDENGVNTFDNALDPALDQIQLEVMRVLFVASSECNGLVTGKA
jgi:hypothetical protein